jgi:SAM domain (Sterile alpha motif)
MFARKVIGDWLERLGMPEYGECFAENKIDLSVLPHLTDQDLKDIGVPLGHRRKMLATVAQLDDTSIAEARVPVPGSLKPQPPMASTSSPTPESAGERRYVTVMFCDLVDSTRDRSEARCRGMARPSRSLSGRSFCGGDGDGRQEARRRA